MTVFVKICGLNDAGDVAAAAAAGADAVGFVFAESVRRVTPRQAADATATCPPGLLRVAVMQHPTAAELREVLDDFAPDVVQTDAGDFELLDVPAEVVTWPVLREGGVIAGDRDTYVYEGPRSGAGEPVDWELAARFAKHGKMILAGGLAEDNVATAIRKVRPWGVDVSSGVESLPGRKDHELIKRFVSAVRAAENEL